ncbi:hypothetical protein [Arcobacter roscoffensis]|uniref:Uncharacterized protein n=1 Tax=Arcobacter roscoffensis TaxID=2961520 RepID=A0ABY5E2R3_9BACT|nr:hypothetical protein [Arcobacter roscoffensis]UTJ05425.1 hypothetical protein NJU99_09110 [Arcobacter roscoffensis]
MKKLFQSKVFQVLAFVLIFIFINIYVIFTFDKDDLFQSFLMVYVSWFMIIILLKFISTSVKIKE